MREHDKNTMLPGGYAPSSPVGGYLPIFPPVGGYVPVDPPVGDEIPVAPTPSPDGLVLELDTYERIRTALEQADAVVGTDVPKLITTAIGLLIEAEPPIQSIGASSRKRGDVLVLLFRALKLLERDQTDGIQA